MSHYERVARIIRFLQENGDAQPSLAEIAKVSGLGVSQMHRLFRAWAGVTPKDFLQCLTLIRARRLLSTSSSVLEAALDSGLSGPGRLHDLTVGLEAATPGEIASGGRGMQLCWGLAESPFGHCGIAWGERGVAHLGFMETADSARVLSEVLQMWPNAKLIQSSVEASALVGKIFERDSGAGGLRAFVRGTAFQLRVWRALLAIPPGRVTSYGMLARAVGAERGARAVGAACGRNPVACLIPCHRVIRETGIARGYRWGDERKYALLARELSRARRV